MEARADGGVGQQDQWCQQQKMMGAGKETYIVCHYDEATTPKSVIESIENLAQLVNGACEILNIYPIDRKNTGDRIHAGNTNNFILHPTITYSLDRLLQYQPDLCKKISSSRGIKILMKQDENSPMQLTEVAVRSLGITHLFGCVGEDWARTVYGSIMDIVAYSKVYTTYLYPTLIEEAKKFLEGYSERVSKKGIDCSYVGADNSASFGSLVFLKHRITELVNTYCKENGIKGVSYTRDPLDPQSKKWKKLLEDSKIHLTVPSGGSAFCYKPGDMFSTSVSSYRKNYPEVDVPPELKYIDGLIPYGQISPRHLEAIVSGCVLCVVNPGFEYSMHPLKEGVHYIEVDKELTQLELLVRKFAQREVLSEWARSAVETLLECDELLPESLASTINKALEGDTFKEQNAIGHLYVDGPAENDPRNKWIRDYNTLDLSIEIIELQPSSSVRAAEGVKYLKKIAEELGIAKNRQTIYKLIDHYCHTIKELDRQDASRGYSSDLEALTEQERLNLLTLLEHIILLSVNILRRISEKEIGIPDVVLCADFTNLLPSIFVGYTFDKPVIYDAHEYPPNANTRAGHYEVQFWESMLRYASPLIHSSFIVTPQLAKLLGQILNKNVSTLPNAAPLETEILELGYKQIEEAVKRCSDKSLNHDVISEIRVLYQGGYGVDRGLEWLIENWHYLPVNFQLYLRGPINNYALKLIAICAKSPAKRRINMLAPVNTNNLQKSLEGFDIGIIPYMPVGPNHQYCCPNKLSQYMSMGMPIVSSRTDYIASILEISGGGITYEMTQESFESVFQLLLSDRVRLEMSRCALDYYARNFNWQTVSREFYASIKVLLQTKNEKENQMSTYDETLYTVRKAVSVMDQPSKSYVTYAILRKVARKARVTYLKLKDYLKK
jgi:glycosyltransferase involved in cell wall biosynthesis